MSTLFTLTITDQAQMGKAQETQLIAKALDIAAQQVRSQKVASSGNVQIEKGGHDSDVDIHRVRRQQLIELS